MAASPVPVVQMMPQRHPTLARTLEVGWSSASRADSATARPLFPQGHEGITEYEVPLHTYARQAGWPERRSLSVPLWMTDDLVPLITGDTCEHLQTSGGETTDRHHVLLWRCHIAGPPAFVLAYSATRTQAVLGYNQYNVGMKSSCTPIAAAWLTLCGDGADPGGTATMIAAFSYATDRRVEGEADVLEEAIDELGLFPDATCQAVSVDAGYALVVLDRLGQLAAAEGPVLVLVTSHGATKAIFMGPEAVWLFDSHCHGGAYVTFFADVSALGGILAMDALATGGDAAQVIFAVIWRGFGV